MEGFSQYPLDYWTEQIRAGYPLSFKEGVAMEKDLNLYRLMKLANNLTSVQVGNVVSYAVSYNINYSNYFPGFHCSPGRNQKDVVIREGFPYLLEFIREHVDVRLNA